MIDLHNIERYHENNRIEAKKAAGGFPHSLWETYSAFANTIGGLILLGVEESRDKQLTVTGIPDAAGYQKILWDTVKDPARVSVNILSPEDVEVHTVDGRDVLVVRVPRADRTQRPVYIGDSPFQGAYRRDGEGDYHCSPEEVRAMLRDREDTPADLAVLKSRPVSDLSPSSVRQYRLLPGSVIVSFRNRPAVLIQLLPQRFEDRAFVGRRSRIAGALLGKVLAAVPAAGIQILEISLFEIQKLEPPLYGTDFRPDRSRRRCRGRCRNRCRQFFH